MSNKHNNISLTMAYNGINNRRHLLTSSNNPNEAAGLVVLHSDHPDDEMEDPTPPSIHRSVGLGGGSVSNVGNTMATSSSASASASASIPPSSLASKPHSFGGAILSPDHARNLTTDLVLQLASALSVQASHAASSRGVLPPGESVNLFWGSELVDVLMGWAGGKGAGAGGIGGVGTAGMGSAASATSTTSGGVFRGGPPLSTPGTPNKSNQPPPQQPPPAHILQILHQGGGIAIGGGGNKQSTTPGTSTPGASSVSSTTVPASPVNTPTDNQSTSHTPTPTPTPTQISQSINQLSLMSTTEALESFASWRTHYTTWITEAWNILKWSEPSAALFWEMATMFHTLYVASLSIRGGGSGGEVRRRILGVGSSGGELGGGGSGGEASGSVRRGSDSVSSTGAGGGGGAAKSSNAANTSISSATAGTPSGNNYIPPLLSCGSQSSMGSVRSAGPLSEGGEQRIKESQQQPSNASAAAVHLLQSPGGHHPSSRSGGMKTARHSEKELPVWLISMFLLVHCEMEAFLRCTSGEDERRFSDGTTALSVSSPLSTGAGADSSTDGGGSSLDFSALLHHRSLSPRTRLHAGMHQNNANCAAFLLRHLRKFILLCAVPRNVAACKAIATLAARGSSGGSSRPLDRSNNIHRHTGSFNNSTNIDIARIESQHAKEHGSIGLNIELTVEELDRLHLVFQAPSGGLVDEMPVAIGEHVLKVLALEEMESAGGGRPQSQRWNLMQNGLITVADAERVLRRYLEEELTMAKQELDGEDHHHVAHHHDHGAEDVSSKMSKLSLHGESATTHSRISSMQPLSPSRSRGVSLGGDSTTDGEHKDGSYLKELSYQKLRSTTVLLEHGKDSSSPLNNAGDGGSSVASHGDQHSQNSSTKSSSHVNPHHVDHNDSGRLHDLHVSDCSDTHFYLLQPFEHATIAACTDCTIVLGAVAGLLHVVDCERTTITSAARRVVVSNSFDVVHYLFTPSPPLLVGDNRGCQFAPYNTYYEGLRDDLLATGLAAVLRMTTTSTTVSGGGGSVAGESTASPGRGGEGRTSPSTLPTLQCASNKWKVPVELCKLEVPQLPNVQTPGSPTLESSGSLSPGADDRALAGTVDVAMKTPVLLPSSEFDVLLVPVESEEAHIRRQLLRESQAEAEEDAPTATAASSSGRSTPDVGSEVGETTTVYSTASSLTGDREKGDAPALESDYCRILADLLTLSPFHMPHDYERRVIAKAERVRTLQQAMQELNPEQRASLEEELNRGFQDWLVTSGNLRQVLDLIHLEKRVAA